MSIVYDINMHRGPRVRSVTNRALIMNENNTRFNLETHFPRRQAIRFNDSCSARWQERALPPRKNNRARMENEYEISIIMPSVRYTLACCFYLSLADDSSFD